MNKLTKEQKIALTGFTGKMLCDNFADFHKDVERRLGEPVFTHQFAYDNFTKTVEELYRDDVMKMCGQ